MGRDSTGAWTTGECLRIELSYLLKTKYLVKGQKITGILEWNRNGERSGSVGITTVWPTDPTTPPYIRLSYVATDRRTNEKEERKETIFLERRPSNIGKGEVLYFICPSGGQRCRILYKAYDSVIWKSRESYQNRIYYSSQPCSKLDYHNSRYWELESQIKKMKGKRMPGKYRGKQTRRAKRLEHLEFMQQVADHGRWRPEAMTLGLRRAVFGNLPGFEYLNEKGGKPTY